MKQKLIDTKEFMKKLTEEIDAVSSEDYDGEEMAEYDWASGWWISTKLINKVLESTLAIEAEPVIRCKDCFFCGEVDENGWHWCQNTGVGMPKDGFCSDAERKGWNWGR